MRHLLFIIAQRVSTPVYVLEKEMPAREFMEWLLVLQAEQRGHEPPDVDAVGVEQMAMGLGVKRDGS